MKSLLSWRQDQLVKLAKELDVPVEVLHMSEQEQWVLVDYENAGWLAFPSYSSAGD